MFLTGNPFVDTGQAVLACLGKVSSVDQLDLATLRGVVGDARQLTTDNSNAKSFTMIFGTNGPLKQPAYKKLGNNEVIYRALVNRLMEAIEKQDGLGDPCELTGIPTSLDFHEVCSQALLAGGQKVPDRKWIGRDWVPLAGSLGNDAQALPAASRPLHVSATALLALQYLPYAAFLFRGRLALFQSTHPTLVQDLVKDLVDENLARIQAGNIEILHKGGGSKVLILQLLRRFEKLEKVKQQEGLPPDTSLFLWLFSNSGTSAECDMIEIPNESLQFLWRSFSMYGEDIHELLSRDPKDPRGQLFNSLTLKRDHPGLYPEKKWAGVSQRFYEHYQQTICGRDRLALIAAAKLALHVRGQLTKKQLSEWCKAEGLSDPARRAQLRKSAVQRLNLREYAALFPSTWHPVRVDTYGWRIIRFYLAKESSIVPAPDSTSVSDDTTHPKIVQLANYLIENRNPARIESILDRLANRKLGLPWLRDVYAELARKKPDFTYPTWDELVCDADGHPQPFELLFQLRLALANQHRDKLAVTEKS